MDSQARSAIQLYGCILIIAVLVSTLIMGVGIGFVVDHYRHSREIALLHKAADAGMSTNAEFWRDEAMRAYQSPLTNTR